jgi:hypothetical protein
MMAAFVLGYLAVAAAFAGHALFAGVVLARDERLFTVLDTLLLATTAVLAGALWIVFAPAMLLRLGRERLWPSIRAPRQRAAWSQGSGVHAPS